MASRGDRGRTACRSAACHDDVVFTEDRQPCKILRRWPHSLGIFHDHRLRDVNQLIGRHKSPGVPKHGLIAARAVIWHVVDEADFPERRLVSGHVAKRESVPALRDRTRHPRVDELPREIRPHSRARGHLHGAAPFRRPCGGHDPRRSQVAHARVKQRAVACPLYDERRRHRLESTSRAAASGVRVLFVDLDGGRRVQDPRDLPRRRRAVCRAEHGLHKRIARIVGVRALEVERRRPVLAQVRARRHEKDALARLPRRDCGAHGVERAARHEDIHAFACRRVEGGQREHSAEHSRQQRTLHLGSFTLRMTSLSTQKALGFADPFLYAGPWNLTETQNSRQFTSSTAPSQLT